MPESVPASGGPPSNQNQLLSLKDSNPQYNKDKETNILQNLKR